MSSFIADTSSQLDNSTLTSTFSTTHTTNTAPGINFNITVIFDKTSEIYHPSANTIKIFTYNTDALTIDSNQCLYVDATGLTHLQYTNIDNKPTNFQSDWNCTIINKPSYFPADSNSTLINTPNLSGYATNTNLNSLPTNSILLINN